MGLAGEAAVQDTYFVYNTPIGRVTIGSDGESVTGLAFGAVGFEGENRATAVTNAAANQVQEYLAGKRRYFDLPLRPAGTDFQLAVWGEIADIPYGFTKSYSDIARAVGRPKAARAVGRAANRNPLAIVVPCHRVVGADGRLAGFAGGAETKRRLLDLERKYSRGDAAHDGNR